MIPLTNKHKLPFRTPPSFFREVMRLLGSLVEEDVKYGKRKLAREAMLNAILLDFLDRSEDERKEVVRRNLVKLYALKEPVAFRGTLEVNITPDSVVADSTISPPDRGGEQEQEPRRKRKG
jgi:hypothetical protein